MFGLGGSTIFTLTPRRADLNDTEDISGPAVAAFVRGGSLVKLQAILGHASIRTTQVFAHLVPDHLSGARRS